MNPHCPRCNHPFEQPDTRFCQQCGLKVGAAPADPLVGMTLLGRYKVIRQLGEGSMGKVYLGEQRVGEDVRNVAIKVLASPRGNDDYIIARFRREASTLAALEHPNIIRLYDYGEENGRFVSVMEYISGGSLAARIAKARLDPATAENFGWQIARALDAAHRQGVVHRDLKPENVLLAPTTDGEPEVVKVVDFGIARRPQTSPAQRALTNVGAVLGTPAFMAPEQLRGETVDPRADVYSFALVVYQMLTARLPWNAYNVIEWTDAQLNQPPTPMRRQAGCEWLPARCDEAIAHALQKRPDDRTPSAIAFMQEFSGRDDAEAPIPAVRTPVAPAPEVDDAPLAPPMRRGSPWLAGFAVVAVASLAGATGSCAGRCTARRTRRRRRRRR